MYIFQSIWVNDEKVLVFCEYVYCKPHPFPTQPIHHYSMRQRSGRGSGSSRFTCTHTRARTHTHTHTHTHTQTHLKGESAAVTQTSIMVLGSIPFVAKSALYFKQDVLFQSWSEQCTVYWLACMWWETPKVGDHGMKLSQLGIMGSSLTRNKHNADENCWPPFSCIFQWILLLE